MLIEVLIIEKNVSISSDIKKILADDNDYNITESKSQDIFNDVLFEEPDIVLIDDSIINKNSIESLKSLKQSKDTLDIPVVILTEYTSEYKIEDLYEFGIIDFIRKPLVREELIMRIQSLINRELYISKLYDNIEHLKELSVVAKNSGNSVVIISTDEKIEWANDGFEKMYGYTFHEFIDKFEKKVFSHDENPKFFHAIKHCLESYDSAVYENLWTTKQGQSKWIQTTLTPILNEQNEVIKFVAIESDITKLKVIEERLEAKNDHLLTLTEHLESTNHLLEKQREEIEEQKEFIENQKKESDKLLLNILPFEIAEQLKKKGFAKSKNYKMVSVLFTDFKGFSALAKQLSSQDLITELNICFEKFDEMIEEHYIEKIKTIGDAYMCVGGLPLRNKSNPFDVILAGLKIQNFMKQFNDIKRRSEEPLWELRLGIHTGEVIAGVIGKKKFAYDIWGDTVNTAARLQEAGDVGKVNISGVTYEHIKDFFDCTFRGKMAVKNAGEIDMYFVNRLKEEYSADSDGIIPNKEFRKILAKY